MKFGLEDKILEDIKSSFSKVPAIQKVILYGSRAKGNYRTGSDIDITLIGNDLTLDNSIYPLHNLLDELYLPYIFDISIFKKIDNKNLIDHINRIGQIIYQR